MTEANQKRLHSVIPSTPFWKRQNSGDGKKRKKKSVVARGWGEGGMNRQSIKDLDGYETILCDPIMMEAGHYTFVQTVRMYSTQNEP